MKTFTSFALIFLFVLTGLNAAIRGVPGTYTTIQAAINASVNGDTVLVEPGSYFENINFRGKKIVVTSRFYIANNLSFISSTIINGSTPTVPDSASVVRIISGEDSTTVLQGFTITGGTGTKWFDEHGAGVYREGGGILIAFTSPVIRFNIIKNNAATNSTGVSGAGGGGLRIGDGNPKIFNNIIMNNTGLYGAGLVLNYTGVQVKNNIIYNNSMSSTYNAGSAIWANSNRNTLPKIIENNTIVGNSSINGTAGIFNGYGANMTVRNNIIWGNVSPGNTQILSSGGGILTATYNDVQNGFAGAGNINIYPQYADSNYILANGSPCVDAGDTSAIYNDPPDAGNPLNAMFPAKGTLRNDMGAYGGPLSSLIAGLRVIGINEINQFTPEDFRLYQNYPNPFNPSTNIQFSIINVQYVTLKIYDVLGKEIETLVNKKLTPGTYIVDWNASQHSSGNYIYRLIAGDYSDTKVMSLVK